MKKISGLLAAFLLIFTFSLQLQAASYGVFLGVDGDKVGNKLKNYKTVVIEPTVFTKRQIKLLKRQGKKVYAYINVGAIERYRPYYHKYSHLTFANYDNWDERWVNISKKKWQKFIISRARLFKSYGYDGFFVDNLDVYAHKKKTSIYNGACRILLAMKQMGASVIINGADVFVSKAISKGHAKRIIDAVNQEEVFTSIDFDVNSYGRQSKSILNYYKRYFKRVKRAGIKGYLLEYRAHGSNLRRLRNYCRANGFNYYNARSLYLR